MVSVSEVPNSAPDWPSGITMEPFFSESSMATSPPCGGLAGDLPIPAGLGEIAVGEIRVPNALLMVAIEPIVGVAGGRFVIPALHHLAKVALVSACAAPRRGRPGFGSSPGSGFWGLSGCSGFGSSPGLGLSWPRAARVLAVPSLLAEALRVRPRDARRLAARVRSNSLPSRR